MFNNINYKRKFRKSKILFCYKLFARKVENIRNKNKTVLSLLQLAIMFPFVTLWDYITKKY